MKVLHVLDVSWPIQRGYSIRGYYITKHQKDHGIKPVVLTSERQYDHNVDTIHNDIKYFRSPKSLGSLAGLPLIRDFFQILRLRNRILKVITTEKVDFIHAHSPSIWGLAALLAGRKSQIKVIYEIRAFWEDAAVDAGKIKDGGVTYKLWRALETVVVKRSDKVVAICQGLKTDLVGRGISPDKVVVVPNGVDTDRFNPVEKDAGLVRDLGLDGKTVFGFVGSMFNFEGLEVLVQAVAALDGEARANIRVLLVGEGESYGRIQSMVDAQKLSGTIQLVGRVPHDHVEAYYSIIDVFVYPRISKRITELVTPLKPLEAMAMGKAVVMSNVGGLVELLDGEECGMLFEAGNAHSLSQVMADLAANNVKVETFGALALNSVRAHRDWNKLARIYSNQVYGA
jgi:PEP-CTERM/exosortase A-associated glycosyltransferase